MSIPFIKGRFCEPWVNLPDGHDLAQWSHADEVEYNQILRQSQKLAFYAMAFDYLSTTGIVGDYHEYGCHRGRTFRMALTEARRRSLDSMKFFAFDSFEGLPRSTSNPEIPGYFPGALRTSEDEFMGLIRTHAIYVENCRTIKGFYQEVLTKDLQSRFLAQERKIAFACVDCDLYESAVCVFNFLAPLLQEGSVLYIDDYVGGYKGNPNQGVVRAFAEFRRRSAYRFSEHLSVGWWGRSFITYVETA